MWDEKQKNSHISTSNILEGQPNKSCDFFWLNTEQSAANSTSDTPSSARTIFLCSFHFLPDNLTLNFTISDHIILDSLRGLWAISATEYKGWKSNCRCKLCYLWSHLVHCNHPMPKGSKTPKMTLCFINHTTFTELSPLAIKWTVLYKHASNLIVPLQASKVHSLPQRENWLRGTWKILTKNNNNKLKQNKTRNSQLLYSG